MSNHTDVVDNKKPLVLVTGCSGLIGMRVCAEMAPHYTIVGLDVKPPTKPLFDLHWRECDLTNDASVDRVLTSIRDEFGGSVASVVHLAAYYDFSGESSPLYEALTVKGSVRLIDGLQQFDCVEQFIFSSSLLVMRPVDDESGKITEASPTQSEWDYPSSKLRTERLLRDMHGEIPLVILRLAGVYDENCHSLPIGQQIRRIYEKEFESYVFPGDAGHGQPFVHLDDVAHCIRLTIDKRKSLDAFERFLIAETDLLSYRELQDTIGELLHGRAWPTIRIPKSVAKAGAVFKEAFISDERFIKPWMIDLADDNYPVETRRARERLDWTPQHHLRDTIPEIISRLKQAPERWYETNKLPVPENVQA